MYPLVGAKNLINHFQRPLRHLIADSGANV